MLLIITGAGASASLNPLKRSNVGLPLTDNLLTAASMDNRFPRLTQLLPKIQRGLQRGEALEAILESFSRESAEDPVRGVQLSEMRIYLRLLIKNKASDFSDGPTVYDDLVERIRHWCATSAGTFCAATFNYDTLMDEALQRAGLNYFRTEDAVSMPTAPFRGYFKLHGSTNWQYRVAIQKDVTHLPGGGRTIGGRTLRTYPPSEQELLGAKLSVNHQDSFQLTNEGEQYFESYPALAIPVAFKNDSMFVIPRPELQKLTDLLKEATGILVVGWRAMEGHFLDILRNARIDVPVQLVCRGGGPFASDILSKLGWSKIEDTKLDFPSYLAEEDRLDSFLRSLQNK
jgi:hypothetical protein